jgi:hypothetical protein
MVAITNETLIRERAALLGVPSDANTPMNAVVHGIMARMNQVGQGFGGISVPYDPAVGVTDESVAALRQLVDAVGNDGRFRLLEGAIGTFGEGLALNRARSAFQDMGLTGPLLEDPRLLVDLVRGAEPLLAQLRATGSTGPTQVTAATPTTAAPTPAAAPTTAAPAATSAPAAPMSNAQVFQSFARNAMAELRPEMWSGLKQAGITQGDPVDANSSAPFSALEYQNFSGVARFLNALRGLEMPELTGDVDQDVATLRQAWDALDGDVNGVMGDPQAFADSFSPSILAQMGGEPDEAKERLATFANIAQGLYEHDEGYRGYANTATDKKGLLASMAPFMFKQLSEQHPDNPFFTTMTSMSDSMPGMMARFMSAIGIIFPFLAPIIAAFTTLAKAFKSNDFAGVGEQLRVAGTRLGQAFQDSAGPLLERSRTMFASVTNSPTAPNMT